MIASITLAACLVTKIDDGDTARVQCPGRSKPIVVRLSSIDAPELAHFTWGEQPGARAALAEATRICGGQHATVQLQKYDPRTRRWIGTINCNGVDWSTDLVSTGFAWSYLPMRGSHTAALMAQAQAAKLGIWAVPGAIQPSVWRKQGMHQ